MTDERWVIRDGSAPDGAFRLCLTPDRAGWDYSGLRILDLPAGGAAAFDTGGEEMLVVPLAGAAAVEVTDGAAGTTAFELHGRTSVFAAHTDRAYLPVGASVRVTSGSGGRFALATSRADRHYPACYLPADRISSALRGTGAVSRQVVDLANADLCPADRLIVCEVYTPRGGTSSAPPHKHDTAGASETALEEIYYFELSDPASSARHRTIASDGRPIDVDATVRDGDVALVPYGWHGPTTAPGDADLYYLNVMAGPVRSWLVTFHPTAGPRPDPAAAVDPRLPLVRP